MTAVFVKVPHSVGVTTISTEAVPASGKLGFSTRQATRLSAAMNWQPGEAEANCTPAGNSSKATVPSSPKIVRNPLTLKSQETFTTRK
jgi:hypothetical protein